MATIDILLQSDFNSEGFQQAIAALAALGPATEAASQNALGGDAFDVFTEGLVTTQELITNMVLGLSEVGTEASAAEQAVSTIGARTLPISSLESFAAGLAKIEAMSAGAGAGIAGATTAAETGISGAAAAASQLGQEVSTAGTYASDGMNRMAAAARVAEDALNQATIASQGLAAASSTPPSNIDALIESTQARAESLRAEARALIETGAAEEEYSEKIREAGLAMTQVQKIQRLAGKTQSELIKEYTKTGASLQEMSGDLRNAAKEFKQLEAQEIRNKNTGTAEYWKQSGENALQAANRIDALDNSIRGVGETAQAEGTRISELFAQFEGRLGNVENIKQFKKQLVSVRDDYRKLRDEAIVAGNQIGIATNTEKIAQIEELDRALFGVESHFQFMGKEADALGKIVQSKFFQVGFAMFLLQNTLRNFTGIFQGIKDSLIEVGDAANRIRNFSDAVITAGIDVTDLDKRLRDASGGYVELATQQQQVIRLINAGLNPVAAQSDELVNLAKAAELASLGLVKAESVYPQLVDAIISGDAATLKSIPGLEGISAKLEAAEMDAKAMGTSLSLLERRQIIITELGKAFDDLDSGDLADAASETRTLAQEMGELKTAFLLTFGALGQDAIKDVPPLIQAIVSPLQTASDVALAFATSLLVIKLLAKAAFEPIKIGISAIKDEIEVLATGISAAIANLATGDLSGALDSLKFIATETQDVTKETYVDLATLPVDLVREYNTAVGAVSTALGLIPVAAQDVVNDTNDALSGINLGSGFDLSGITAQLDFILGDQRKFMMESVESWDDYNEKIADINMKYDEDFLKLKQDYFDDLADMREKFSDKSIDLAEKLGEKLADIDSDYTLKDSRMVEDAEDKKQDVREKSAKKLEEIEEKHQKKIDDIMRRFELARLKALIDRDARALFEAERRRDEDLQKEKEAAEEKKQDEIDNRNERLKEIEDDLAKRRARAAEDAELARQEARAQHTKDMEDLRDQWAEERDARQEKFEEDREDAKKAADKARADAWEDLKDRITDLKKHYAERNRIAQAQAIQDKINLLLQQDQASQEAQDLYDEINAAFTAYTEDTTANISELVDAYQELAAIGPISLPPVGGVIGAPGSGTSPQPPPPVGGPTRPAGCDIFDPNNAMYVGMTCYQPPTQVICDKYGNKFVCVDGKLASHAGSNLDAQMTTQTTMSSPQRTTNSLPSSFFGGVATQQVQTSGTERIPVTIQVEGDETLKEILRGISYEAFIEITRE